MIAADDKKPRAGRDNAGGARPLQIVVLLRRALARPGAVADDEVLGRCERAALAAALALGAALGGEVTALGVGPARREDRVLAMALRAGCHRAVRVWDESFDSLDYLGLARVLAAAVKRVGGELVLAGDRSHDEAQGAIGPALAELLAMPHLGGVIDLRADGDAVLVERRADGWHDRFRVSWPAVICVQRMPARSGDAAEADARAVVEAAIADDRTRSAAEAAAEDDAAAPPGRRRRARSSTPGDRGGRAGSGNGEVTAPPAGIEIFELHRLAIDPRALAHRSAFAGRVRATRGRGAVVVRDVDDLLARLRDDRVLG